MDEQHKEDDKPARISLDDLDSRIGPMFWEAAAKMFETKSKVVKGTRVNDSIVFQWPRDDTEYPR